MGTKEAYIMLKRTKAYNDIDQVCKTKRMRAGKGKMRNRRRIMKRGPLIVYDQDQGLTRAFRNLPGVDTISVDNLNILKLAQPKMAVTDLSKLLKAEEIRKVLRAPDRKVNRAVLKMNPLKNVKAMLQLNPYEAVSKRNALLISKSRAAAKAAAADKKAGKKAKPDPLAKRRAALAKKTKAGKGK